PASVVSVTISSLTRAIVDVEVRTGLGKGAERKYVSSVLTFMAPPASARRPLLEHRLVHLDAETQPVKREDGTVRVLPGTPHDVTGKQQRTEQLAPPRHRRRRHGDGEVGGGAERGLDHAADVGAEARRLRHARDRHRPEETRGFRELQTEDAHAAQLGEGE